MEKGNWAEYVLHKFCCELIKRDIEACIPISEHSRYDIVCGKKFNKIQLKKAFISNYGQHNINNYTTYSRKSGSIKNKYTPKQIDFLVGYVEETDEFYIIPMQEVKKRWGIPIWVTKKPKNPKYDIFSKFKNRFDLLEK